MSEIKKIGIVGCGSIAEIAHLPSIAKCEQAKLEALCDVDGDRAKTLAKKWDSERIVLTLFATPPWRYSQS